MKLIDTSLYRIATTIDLLRTITRPAFDPEAKSYIDEDHPRVDSNGACRVFFIIESDDGESYDTISQMFHDRLNSTIPIDIVFNNTDSTTYLETATSADEIVTKNIFGLGWTIGHILDSGDHSSLPAYLSLVSGICMVAFNDPLDIVIYLKRRTQDNGTYLDIDWLWFRDR